MKMTEKSFLSGKQETWFYSCTTWDGMISGAGQLEPDASIHQHLSGLMYLFFMYLFRHVCRVVRVHRQSHVHVALHHHTKHAVAFEIIYQSYANHPKQDRHASEQ